MPVPESLLAAYRAARYVVFADNAPVLRIGEPCPELDDLLEAEGAAGAAFVTSFNPRGLPAHEELNQLSFGELCEAADRTGCRIYLGEGRDPKGEWKPEPSLLIVGIARAEAEALGRRFHQLAIVFAEKGKPPELVLLE
ncbi:MAG: DUF3293 domain-containing protein [Betaproteobacteria bacterium]|nr:DUF3293 domain-containing protein [Betaproteobacteria bacterium]